MKNWTIGKRIVSLSGLLLALLVAIGATGYLSLRTVRGEAVQIRDDNVAGLVSCGLLSTTMQNSFIRTLLAGQAASPEERERLITEQESFSAKTSAAVDDYERSVFEDEDRRLFNAVKSLRADYGELRAKYYVLVRAGRVAEASCTHQVPAS